MILNKELMYLKQLKLMPTLVDYKLNLYQFDIDGTTFLVSFLRTGRKTKIFLFSSNNWKAFLDEEELFVKLKIVKRARILKNTVFQKLKAVGSINNRPMIKVIITEHISRTYVLDEHDAEYVKPEDTIDGVHIMNERKFKKFLSYYNDDRHKKSSIEYHLDEEKTNEKVG
jgi:hypothetical protein